MTLGPVAILGGTGQQGSGLARRLAAAGVPYRLDVHPGVVHGFMQQTAKVARARAALAAIVDHLKRALA